MASETPSGGVQGLPTSNMALVSLIAGILGLSIFPLLGSIVAVITGQMARREIRESAGTLGGDGLATAGLVLGWIGIGLSVIGLCIGGVFIAIPFCLTIFAAVNEASSALPLLLAFV